MSMIRGLAVLGASALFGLFSTVGHGADALGRPVRSGDLRTERALSGVMFHYLPEPVGSTDAAAFQAIRRHLGRIEVVTEPLSDEQPPVLELIEEKRPLRNFIIPQPAYLANLGGGLDARQIQAMQASARVARMMLVTTAKDAFKHNARLVNAAYDYARETHAVVLDISTRECFSLEAWKRLRLDPWGPALETPDLSTQVLISVYAPHR